MPLLKDKLKILKCNIVLLIFLSATFILGFILGVFFRNNCCDSPYFNGVYTYYICIFNIETSVFAIFFKRLFACLGVYLVVFLLGLNKYSAFVSSIILFYRGLILGSVAAIFISLYGISGFLVYVLLVLIQNLIITAGMIVAVVLNAYYSDSPLNCKINDLIADFIVSFAVCLAGVLYELLFLTFVLRPLTLWF